MLARILHPFMKWSFVLDFLLPLIDTPIVRKDISSFHELTFVVYQGFLLMVHDVHIANKDIFFFHILNFFGDLYSHCPKGYSIHIWTDLVCWSRLPFVFAGYSHCPQKKFSHSWSDPLCLSRLTFVVDWYSHCPKDISFFHEVVFCAHIDFLLVLLDTHITHKDNSFMNWPSVHEIILFQEIFFLTEFQ